MRAFTYVAARSVAEAVDLLAQYEDRARLMAGGTDLLVQMREGRRQVTYVVDIKPIREVNELSVDPASGLCIGAAVPCLRIWDDPTVAARYPGLVDAVSLIGGVQIQARATLGGNLGNASPAADSIPALIVHEAVCEIVGPKGSRRVPVEHFCTGPSQTILGPGEFLVRQWVKDPPMGFGASYLRFTPRNEMDIAVAGAAASVRLDDSGRVFQAARIALAAVAPTPLFVLEAGAALVGQPVSENTVEAAAQVAQAAARPISDVRGTAAQRSHLAAVLTRRALWRAVDRARASLEEA